MLVRPLQEFHELRASMSVSDQSQNLPTEQIDAGQQRQGTAPLVFMIRVGFSVSIRESPNVRRPLGDRALRPALSTTSRSLFLLRVRELHCNAETTWQTAERILLESTFGFGTPFGAHLIRLGRA